MKKLTYLLTLLFAVVLAFGSCTKKDVDLNNIDTQLEADMALAIPVGSASVTLGDLLEIGRLAEYFKVSNDTLYYFYHDTLKTDFHPIDLTEYVSSASESIPVKKNWPSDVPFFGGVIPAGIKFNLDYEMPIQLSGINSNINNERIDYAEIDSACFTTTLNLNDMAGLKFSDIESLKMYMPTATFTLHDQTPVGDSYIIDIPLAGKDFGQQIPININNFRLNLQNTDKSVVDKLSLKFRFEITTSEITTVTDNSSINYRMDVLFLDYSTLYGFFQPSNLVSDTNTVSLFESLGNWSNFKQFMLPIAEPKVEFNIETSVGVPLMFIIHELYSYSQDNPSDKHYATFDGSKEDRWDMPNFVKVTDPLGTVSHNYRRYDSGSRGRLAELFTIRPDIINYAYETIISPTHSEVKQHRLEKDSKIYIQTDITVPFVFNPTVKIEYLDTVKDVTINQWSIDSIVKQVEQIDTLKAASLKLVLNTENWIPFDINAEVKFYDKSHNKLNIQLQETGDMIVIPGPTDDYYFKDAAGKSGKVVQTPCDTTFIWEVNNDELLELSKVDYIVFDLFLGDNTVPCDAYSSSRLKLNLGLAADVTAIVDPSKSNNK